jgi:hypothetical protein
MLPMSDCSFLVRTDFTSDEAWQQVICAAQAQYEDGFQACIEPVSDPAFDRATWQAVKAAAPANDHGASVLFAADSTTLTQPDRPVLVVDLLDNSSRQPFRCIPSERREQSEYREHGLGGLCGRGERGRRLSRLPGVVPPPISPLGQGPCSCDFSAI